MLDTPAVPGAPEGAGPPREAGSFWMRRIALPVVILLVLAVAAGAALLAVTPGVGDAEQRAAAIAGAHRVVYPGPVPSRFAAALIATEDSRFYSHPGIDPVGVARVVSHAITGGGDPGGATLDQQLAKQLYTGGREGGPVTKTEQVTLAVKLDATYTKQQVLQMYTAVVYFGHGFWGLTSASEGYFGIPPQELSWGQAALLAGLLQAPSAYDPLTHPALARARRQHVLDRLVDTGRISAADAAAAAGSGVPS